jgi:hypothetical protein
MLSAMRRWIQPYHCTEVSELGVSIDVVYSAKSRVLRRLREE